MTVAAGLRCERLQWGVVWTTGPRDRDPVLLGELWDDQARDYLQAHPRFARPVGKLLFTTRAAAAAWCALRNDEWRERADELRHWRMRPVRVRVVVEALRRP